MKIRPLLKNLFCTLMLTLATAAQANDNLNSELSHATAGMVLAGALTKVYEASPNRAWLGFSVSAAVAVLIEGYSISRGSSASSQLLDMASHTLGSAIGAWATDRYLLSPMITPKSVGLVYQQSF